MLRALTAWLVALALLAPVASAQTSLRSALSRAMAHAGSGSGAYVMDADTNRMLFSRRATTPRILASNTKLFTSAAALGRLGPDATLATVLAGTGELRQDGTWDGNLFLRGGGDPTFGDARFTGGYGSTANVEAFATALSEAGFTRVTGHVYGDESLWDPLRGVYDSDGGTSPWIGPLSALDFDHGYGTRGFLTNPASYAADRLDSALEGAGVSVRGKPGVKAVPPDAVELTEVRSPPVAALIRFQNKASDNFFAEMLAKGLALYGAPGSPVRPTDALMPAPPSPDAAAEGAPEARPALALPPAPATTASGAAAVTAFARTLGSNPRLVDGSGLSRPDRASPRSVVRLLDGMRERDDFPVFRASLPIAGRDGTLDNRMRSGPARGHCRGKTGTLSGVSALSGYCTTRGGRTVVFSVLNNGIGIYSAHAIQDRVAQLIAGWRG